MPRLLLGFATALPFFALFGSAFANPDPSQVAGRYVAEVQGQRVELVLRADGTGELAGEAGTWRFGDNDTLLLGDTMGNVVYYAKLAGDQMTVSDGSMSLTFTRVGKTRAPAPSPTAPEPTKPSHTGSAHSPFRPAKLLAGKKVAPKGTRVSFTVPKGWQHKWGTTDSGDKAYLVIPPRAQNSAAIFLSYRLLSPTEARQPVATLLRAGANQLLGQATAQIVVGPEEFSVGGKSAGRLIFQSQLGTKTVEGYLGGVLVDDFAYVVLGLYDAAKKDELRAGADTVLASFRGQAPAENLALKRQIAGCWQSYKGSSSSIGSSGAEFMYRFSADGSYAYRYTGSISVQAGSTASEDHDQGSYRVFGEQVTLLSNKGESSTYNVRRKGNGLVLGDREYWACQ